MKHPNKRKNKHKNKHKQGVARVILGFLLLTFLCYCVYENIVRLRCISNENQLSIASKLLVTVTNRTAATASMTTASSCANISVHNTKTIQKNLHVGTRHARFSGLMPKEEMALEQSILKRIEVVCGCTKHFPRLLKPLQNHTMISTNVGTPWHPVSHPPVGLHEEDAVEQVGIIIQCLHKSRIRHLDLIQATDNACKNMAVQHNKSTNTYTIALFDFDIAAMDEIFPSPKLQELSDQVAINFNDYLSIQHHHMMTKCLGFKNYTTTDAFALSFLPTGVG